MSSKSIIKKILCSLPLRKIIVFESNPEFSCNSYPVYLELKRRCSDYKLVWMTAEGTKNTIGADSLFTHNGRSLWSTFLRQYYYYFSSAFVSCNNMFEKRRPDQLSIFLCHGSKTKKTRGIYEVDESVDYINVQSHFFDDIITYEYNCPAEKLVYLGYPRCDWLFEGSDVVDEKVRRLGLNASRYVLWLPTFRKHNRLNFDNQMNLEKYNSMGMPLVYTPEELKRLDDHLAAIDTCILFKPHPVQDISSLKAADLSHIHIINDQDLAERGLQLYEVLAGSSALITDYSSVYFDYLLLDRPIATTTDDIEAWKQMTGFAFDLEAFYDRSTTRCATLDSLMQFLSETAEGEDRNFTGRRKIREMTNMWNDGGSAGRVADFIMKKLAE